MQPPSESKSPKISGKLWKAVARLTILMILMLAVLFLSAGDLIWWEAWAYVAQGVVIMLVSRTIIILRNPDLALERAEAGQMEGVKEWDKTIVPWITIYLPLISWVLAGLDKRFGWSPDLPDMIQIIALGFLFIGGLIGSWAMACNRFFSSHVRIQTDRGHTVVSSGPYRVVRHPGYSGGLLSWIAAPFFFSSYWVALPAIAAVGLNILRTALEDRTLKEELPGYIEYTRKVRYRLIPGIW